MHVIAMRKKRATAVQVFATLAAVVVLGGCAMKGDVRDLQDEIRALAARQDSLLTELRAETLSTQDSVRTQSDQMFDFRGDINQSIRQIGQSLQRLEALAGENQRGIAAVRQQLGEMRPANASRPAPPLVLADSVPGGGEQLVAGGPGNPNDVWAAAMTQYDRESFNAASMAFQQFIADYPDHPRVPQAYFNLADILQQQDRPEDALEEFQRIPQLFPTSNVVPGAMYRAARLLHQLGDDEQAKLLCERIINTYADVEPAITSLARELLDEIG